MFLNNPEHIVMRNLVLSFISYFSNQCYNSRRQLYFSNSYASWKQKTTNVREKETEEEKHEIR